MQIVEPEQIWENGSNTFIVQSLNEIKQLGVVVTLCENRKNNYSSILMDDLLSSFSYTGRKKKCKRQKKKIRHKRR